MPGRRRSQDFWLWEHTWNGKQGATRRILLALAAYRRELLVDPGVHLRSVETAR